jgi:hypothetical protein
MTKYGNACMSAIHTCTLGHSTPLSVVETGEGGREGSGGQARSAHEHHRVPKQVSSAKHLYVLGVGHRGRAAADPCTST